jgi:endonuclease/exonuclease/phosphatase family metal-dependent hydrolase
LFRKRKELEMPFYYKIDNTKENERRIASNLLKLKSAFVENKIPVRGIDKTLMLATFNIREFDSGKFGERTNEPLYYLAEIISCFDIVAVQEVREDLAALNRLMRILGGWWKCLLTDITRGGQGNGERLVFLYDSRKITFGGLACEIVIPPVKKEGKELIPSRQLARTPFMVGFQSGWFKFTICTVHIYYGEAQALDPQRVEEIREIAKFLASEAKEKFSWAKNMILLGDFNIFSTTDDTMKAITDAGFFVPAQLQKLPSNIPQNKHYDQMAFISPQIENQIQTCDAGVFNYYNYVYLDSDENTYTSEMGKDYEEKPDAKKKTTYYKQWRTHQMSDHLPMWIELKVDFGEEYLLSKSKPPEG